MLILHSLLPAACLLPAPPQRVDPLTFAGICRLVGDGGKKQTLRGLWPPTPLSPSNAQSGPFEGRHPAQSPAWGHDRLHLGQFGPSMAGAGLRQLELHWATGGVVESVVGADGRGKKKSNPVVLTDAPVCVWTF